MGVLRGVVRNGAVVLPGPTDWPDGTPVEVRPTALSDEAEHDDPAVIADWCRWLDSLQPLELTPEQEQRIADARRDDRARELAAQPDRDAKLRRLFEP
jgi:hypothetical protein